MIITAHVVSGGLLGDKLGDPLVAFVAGIVLHYILDAIPHFDNVLENKRWTWKQWVFTGTDLFITAVLFINLTPNFQINNPFIWGAFGGLLPDLLDNVPFWSKAFRNSRFGKKIFQFHEIVHPKKEANVFWGMLTQVVTVAFFFWLSGRLN